MKLNTQRFILTILTTAGLIAAGVGIFLTLSWGKEMTAVAVGLLTLLIRELGGAKAAAFAWFFDGAPTSTAPITTSLAIKQAPGAPTATAEVSSQP